MTLRAAEGEIARRGITGGRRLELSSVDGISDRPSLVARRPPDQGILAQPGAMPLDRRQSDAIATPIGFAGAATCIAGRPDSTTLIK
jgi:hypothetical protein